MIEQERCTCTRVAGVTRSGRYKDNEDAFGYRAEPFDSADIAVVDGAGRVRGESIADFSNKLVHRAMRYLRIYDDPERALGMLEKCDAVFGGREERAAVMLASVRGDAARIAWKGDVCAWRIGPDGSLAERITRLHRRPGGALTRWVGVESRGASETIDVGLRPGEGLLIATDGVLFDIDRAEMSARKARTLDGLADAFIEGAPGADDATVVLVRRDIARNRLRDRFAKRSGRLSGLRTADGLQ